MAATFEALLMRLQSAEVVPRPNNEEWKTRVERISIPGPIAEVTEEDFFYWLDVLPPKYQRGSLFAFAEGAEPLRIFWRRGGQHFCRQLTWDETKEFCRLARIPLPS